MRRLIHKPVALAGRQRRSFVPTGLRLPQPRPAGAFVNKPHPFPNFLPDLLFAELDAHNLAKVPAPDRPGQLWQSDITSIETEQGWLYLAFTLDACSRRCIAHHCRQDMLAELTTTTFKHAVTRQRPLAGLIHHSDRGSQYAADAFQHCLRAWSVTPSMSPKGNPYDNALAESFVATLKTECFGDSIPPTKVVAKLMVFDYIETFYNTRRRHSALGYRSPAQFEHHSLCSQREGCSGGDGQG